MLRLTNAIGLTLLATSTAWAMATCDVGNKPLFDANYKAWPNAMSVINDPHRVYCMWVNGNEHFDFKGQTQALNAALKNFAAIKADRRVVVVLRPELGKIVASHGAIEFNMELMKNGSIEYNWNRTKLSSIEFNWQLHLLGGLVKIMSTSDLGSNIWDPNLCLHVYVGGAIKLDDIKIPEGVEVLEIADLQLRYAACLASRDKTVRGLSCGHLAGLDPYNVNSMRSIATLLNDRDNWVKVCAADALAQFTSNAKEAIEKLQAVKTVDKQLQQQIQRSIESLRKAQVTEAGRLEHQQSLESIHAFVAEWKSRANR